MEGVPCGGQDSEISCGAYGDINEGDLHLKFKDIGDFVCLYNKYD